VSWVIGGGGYTDEPERKKYILSGENPYKRRHSPLRKKGGTYRFKETERGNRRQLPSLVKRQSQPGGGVVLKKIKSISLSQRRKL